MLNVQISHNDAITTDCLTNSTCEGQVTILITNRDTMANNKSLVASIITIKHSLFDATNYPNSNPNK